MSNGSDLDSIFNNMRRPAKPAKEKKADVDEPEPLVHDEIVLLAARRIDPISALLYEADVITDRYWGGDLDAVFEYEIHGGENSDRYVDLAITKNGRPIVLLEIKSQRESQTASGWYRQIRRYSELTCLPCVLVIAHDLPSWMRDYLDATRTHILDLRPLL